MVYPVEDVRILETLLGRNWKATEWEKGNDTGRFTFEKKLF